jgi:hypothetical protein
VTVVDTTPPDITCGTNRTVECGSAWTFDAPTATDLCDGTNVVIHIVSTVTNGLCGNTFSAIRTWEAIDSCTNSAQCSQTVTVLDSTPPTVTCGTNRTVECGTAWEFDPPTATDLCDGTNVVIHIVRTVTNGLCGNTFSATRTWEATDSCTNATQCSQTVTVLDSTPPTVTCGTNRTIECGSAWTFDPPTATDLCDGTNVAIQIVSTVTNSSCGNTFSATRTWEATDSCTNASRCSQTVTVVDTTPPVILCEDTNTCDPNLNVTVRVADDCDPNPQVSCTRSDGQPLALPFPAGMTVVRCTATDGCSNSASCQFTVTVAGGITAIGPTNQVACSGSNVTFRTTVMGPAVADYVWKFNGAIILGANSDSITITNVSATNAGTYCVEVSGSCNVTNCALLSVMDCQPVQAGFCSLNQGFYGNPDGSFQGTSTLTLLTNLLTSSNLVVGEIGARSLTIRIEDLAQLVQRMPAGGTAATLPNNGDQILNMAILPLESGKFDNALLGQTIALALNVRLDTNLLSLRLTNMFCTADAQNNRETFEVQGSVLAALADPALDINSVTVAGLLKLANRGLAALPTGSAILSDIDEALEEVNASFDQCRTQVDCETPAPLLARNDMFDNRIILGGPAPVITVSGRNVYASAEPGEPTHAAVRGGKSVWWQWTPAQSGWVGIHTLGSSFDTLLAVYTGYSVNGLTLVTDNNDLDGQIASEVIFYATAGTDYQIAVDGCEGKSGSIVMSIIETGTK